MTWSGLRYQTVMGNSNGEPFNYLKLGQRTNEIILLFVRSDHVKVYNQTGLPKSQNADSSFHQHQSY